MPTFTNSGSRPPSGGERGQLEPKRGSLRDNATTNLMFKGLGGIDLCAHSCPFCFLGTEFEGGENCWGRDKKLLFFSTLAEANGWDL